MKKFEVGKIYVKFTKYSWGSDERICADYYLIKKRSKKALWVKRATTDVYWGKYLMSKEEALNIDPSRLNFSKTRKSKLKTHSVYNDREYFIFPDKELASFTIKHYIYSEYCKEVGGNK